MSQNYIPGDTFSYHSVTQGHLVTWTRDAEGIWHADDNREATATDHDVRIAQSQDTETDWPEAARRMLKAGEDPVEAEALKRDTLTAILGLDAHIDAAND